MDSRLLSPLHLTGLFNRPDVARVLLLSGASMKLKGGVTRAVANRGGKLWSALDMAEEACSEGGELVTGEPKRTLHIFCSGILAGARSRSGGGPGRGPFCNGVFFCHFLVAFLFSRISSVFGFPAFAHTTLIFWGWLRQRAWRWARRLCLFFEGSSVYRCVFFFFLRFTFGLGCPSLTLTYLACVHNRLL